MGYTTVKAHTRRSSSVRAHSRRTTGSRDVADVLARDLDKVHEQLDRKLQTRPVEAIANADPQCEHPGWYPVYHIDGDRILAYCCTHCAGSRLVRGSISTREGRNER